MTFQSDMNKVSGPKLAGMVSRINRALDKRIAFEQAKAPKSSHIELKAADKQLRGNKTVAAFLAVLGADPDKMLNNERKAGYRSNLKAIRKIRMLAEYMAGEHGAVNGVVKALFAATILAAKNNSPWTSNKDAEQILLGLADRTDMPTELLCSVVNFTSLNILDPSEARNQACQFRTAFENLGVFFFSREDANNLSSNGIYADLNNPLIKALANKWGL